MNIENIIQNARKIANQISEKLPILALEFDRFADSLTQNPSLPEAQQNFVELLQKLVTAQASRKENLGIKLGIKMTLDKFEGDPAPGKEPIETIVTHESISL